MWMLLEPDARKPTSTERPKAPAVGARVVDEHSTKSRTTPKLSLLEYLGAAATAPQPPGASAPVAVFLHPGRAPVGSMGIERVFDQFDCVLPRVHSTLSEAESCHETDVGFLLEVKCAFVDPRGARHPSGVLFARSVRA